MKAVFCLFIGALFLWISPVHGQDLSIDLEDLRIEQRVDGGFHLFIRKKPDIASVLLTESTRDPALREDNFAYRSPDWNPINGDELRVLNGRPISREQQLWSLIDSSPETHPELGAAFHIYIPYILNFGSENSRHGEVYVANGTYFNIRAFSLPYADYRGRFKDNPYVLEVTQKPLEGPPEGNYMKDTVDAFTQIAAQGHGEPIWSTGHEDLVDKIKTVLDKEPGRSLDLVLCFDTTSSMRDDIDPVRRLLIPMLKQTVSKYQDFRIGMVLYKDYFDEYLNRVIPFTRDFAAFQRSLNAISVSGGRDIPEAIYEALYEGAVKFPWEGDTRLLILIGDAPPHARARGKISKAMVDEAVAEQGLKVYTIILPQ
ncbi:VWA domain-containing protein [Treponema sp. TIM-1]|uniref:vWA domain-containing protein n=1 Tax=Treponema sp. TIM-1 TaxID=2898417 RepID=UPI0039802B57